VKRVVIVSAILYFALNLLGCSYLPISTSQSPAEAPKKETYTVIKGQMFQSKGTMLLKTVASWSGEESKNIRYKATKSPWVINYGATPTSRLASKLSVRVYKKLSSEIGLSMNDYGETLVEDTGDFDIKVESSGCKWWVKIGTE
jgi:hypothetical protein